MTGRCVAKGWLALYSVQLNAVNGQPKNGTASTKTVETELLLNLPKKPQEISHVIYMRLISSQQISLL